MMVADARRVSAETPRTCKLKDKKNEWISDPFKVPSMQNEGSRRTLARRWKRKRRWLSVRVG
jgi:hypothetical protein